MTSTHHWIRTYQGKGRAIFKYHSYHFITFILIVMCKNSFIILFFEFIKIMIASAAETETDSANSTENVAYNNTDDGAYNNTGDQSTENGDQTARLRSMN